MGIELAFLKGTDGNNKYGADPLRKVIVSDNSSAISETSKPKIASPTKIKTLTPEEIEIRRKRKEAKMIYRQKVLKAKGRCIICGEKLGIIDRLKGEIYCPEHKAIQ